MKTLHYFLILIILFLLSSCKQADAVITETDFSFQQSQPISDSKIGSFPRKIIGRYIDTDSTYLIVTDKQLIYKWVRKNNTSFEDFEKIKDSSKIVGNRICFKSEFYEFRKLKDSIEITSMDYDTIFSISENQIAKKIKGSVILNTKDSIFWKIKMLSLDKRILNLTTLASFKDLDRIDSLSKTKVQKIDSTRNIIQLTRKEFKNMLKLKKFGYSHSFKRTD
ncbi:hypothetical protein QWY90_06480 [Flavobacterium paronense]|uniref:Lipoprotein n=1 Tax=Flavobacterium paronense TaxID=1392775 RepID=A0ABV5GG06_9FLAO|nr:hypothetical protein [Flavobacterium paronense]MDN3676953.1 hypothetical protein [Flavobacterium paronense]